MSLSWVDPNAIEIFVRKQHPFSQHSSLDFREELSHQLEQSLTYQPHFIRASLYKQEMQQGQPP